MTDSVRELLLTFDTLAPADQQDVAAEILRRAVPSDDLSEDALHGLADELFRGYDAEEAAHAAAQSR
ncbi:MAG: hypothetical protein NTY19_14025 [Planctomycetota bacterium]|nr:hypothetical protein [Planctomycetota bacterium]